MSISASMVRDLREKTNAGMMDCKKALEESKGNFEAAVEWLRVKGLASAAKKADRLASEGLVFATAQGGKTGIVLEVNSETDFVARNDGFKKFVSDVAQVISANKAITDVTTLLSSKSPTGEAFETYLKETISRIGENLVVRRFARVDTNGYVHSYIHGDGKIGVLVEVETANASEAVKTFANDVALHVAAMNPISLSPEEVPADVVSKEKEILKGKAIEQGKKPEMLDKIVEGQIRKFLAESCLLEQAFVKNPDLKVKDYQAQVSKDAGSPVTIKRYVRYELGEGLQKKVNDFAAEVAAQTQGH